jgi:hypothetical protein
MPRNPKGGNPSRNTDRKCCSRFTGIKMNQPTLETGQSNPVETAKDPATPPHDGNLLIAE